MLEGPVTLRAVKWSLSSVSELVSPDIRRPGERLPARFTTESFLLALNLRGVDLAVTTRRFFFTLLCVSFGEKFNGGEYFIGAGGKRGSVGF